MRKKLIITPEQFQQICDRLDEPFRTMVVIAMCLGLRVSEILALKWADFDFEEGTLMITRGTVHGRIGRVKRRRHGRSLVPARQEQPDRGET